MDEEGLERVRSLMVHQRQSGGPPVLLLPTHRSYVDFLLLSYLFFAYNLPLPHIAAADDFLKLKSAAEVRLRHRPLRRAASLMHLCCARQLMRQCGAFFIRRGGEEGGDGSNDAGRKRRGAAARAAHSRAAVRRAVMAAYVTQLLACGHTVEIFVEGSRSRSGKVRPCRLLYTQRADCLSLALLLTSGAPTADRAAAGGG